MFKLDQSETYWYPVTVEMTSDDGRRRKFDFEAEFERIPQSEIKEMFRPRDEDEPKLQDDEVVERVFRGWRKIVGPDDQPLEVNHENRRKLLDTYPVTSSIVKAFLKSIGIEGRAKN